MVQIFLLASVIVIYPRPAKRVMSSAVNGIHVSFGFSRQYFTVLGGIEDP